MLFDIHRGFKKTFGDASLVFAILSFAIVYYVVASIIIAHTFLASIYLSDKLSSLVKLKTFIFTIMSSFPDMPLVSAISVFSMIALLAINTVLAFVLFKKSRAVVGGAEVGTGLLGVLIGIFGIGCASCGSILLATILLSGGGVSLAIINTLGILFAIGGPVLLLLATLLLFRKLGRVEVCITN